MLCLRREEGLSTPNECGAHEPELSLLTPQTCESDRRISVSGSIHRWSHNVCDSSYCDGAPTSSRSASCKDSSGSAWTKKSTTLFFGLLNVFYWMKTPAGMLTWFRQSQSRVFPGTLYHAGHVATTTCHGDDLPKARPRSMRRCATASESNDGHSGTDNEGFFLKRTIRWNGRTYCFMWCADLAHAK